MAQTIVKQFADKLPRALKEEKAHLALIRYIKTDITNEPQLVGCLRHFCESFDADGAVTRNTPRRQPGLVICYNLFVQSTILAGQLNQLIDLIPHMANPESADEKLFASRWQQLSPNDQKLLREHWEKARKRLADTRTLITPLVKAFINKNKDLPKSVNELLDFNPGADAGLRQQFDAIAAACATVWARFNFHTEHLKPSPENLQKLDDDFANFSRFLKDKATDPLVFFQVLKWIREGGAKVVTKKVEGEKRLRAPHALLSIWEELYLEACYHAVAMAGSKNHWNLITLHQAKGLPKEDEEFFISPLRNDLAMLREKLKERIKYCLKDLEGAREIARARRRNDRYAVYSGFELLDEFETTDLGNRIAYLQKNKPEAITQKYIRTASQQLVFNDSFRVKQSVMGEFTVVWIEDDDPRLPKKVVVEFHTMDCVLFRMDASRLRAAVETAFYKTLAKNAEALKIFLLAYLELLGLVLDIVTAGMAGGFRRFLFEFVKERVKDKLTDKALDAAGIDNQALRILAGMGINALKIPKRGAGAKVEAGTADNAVGGQATGFDPKSQRSTVDPPPAPPKSAPEPAFSQPSPLRIADPDIDVPRVQEPKPRSVEEKQALKEADVSGADRFEQRRLQIEREQARAARQAQVKAETKSGQMKMAAGSKGSGGDVVLGDVPHTTYHLPANGVSRPRGGAPSSTERGIPTVPRAVPAKSVAETVRRILKERFIPNPPGGRTWDKGTSLMDAETRRILGDTVDLRIAGTGGIDRIKARLAKNGELEVTIQGVLLPNHLSRNPAKGTRVAPDFNAVSKNNGFRINEMNIKGPRGQVVTVQRAHLWGPGFGDEAAAGMFLAPAHVNLAWQNQHMENYLRTLAEKAGGKGGFVRLEAKATSWGREVSLSVGTTGEKFLKNVEYRIELHMPGKKVETRTVKLDVPEPPALDVDVQRASVWDWADSEGGDDLMDFVRAD